MYLEREKKNSVKKSKKVQPNSRNAGVIRYSSQLEILAPPNMFQFFFLQ